MDLLCTRCGEPWGLDHVLHEEPEDFERDGCLIRRCPCCAKKEPQLSKEQREHLDNVVTLALLHGDDIDGFVIMLEDYNLL
jgi:hypothetical protein